tara:strand:- start:284 stop:1771 length:1488 start_codon:yes stop_codon:yes gene_type:complete
MSENILTSKIIILDNKKAQIISEDPSLLRRLRVFLSFKMAGVEYTPAFKNGWSGITYLLTKNNSFNLGLLEKVKGFLLKNKAEYTIQDKRKNKSLNESIDLSVNLNKYNLIPREHQLRICNVVDLHDRGIVRAATGAGKTLVTALITAKKNLPTIIYVIGLDLLDQFHKLFSKLFDEKIGYIGNGVCEPERITIASIWTIGRSLSLDDKSILDDEVSSEKEVDKSSFDKIKECLLKAKLHIFDESHVVTTNTIAEIYKAIDPQYIYGFSGTPFRGDNSDLLINGILGEQIIDVPASELIKKGLLAQPIIKFVAVPKKHLENNSQYQSVYKEYIVENDIRNNLIIKSVQMLLDKKYTPLVLFKQIKHGDILLEKMQNANMKCEMLHGNDSIEQRNKVKEMLVNGEINVILASTIFDIGLDLPELSGLVLCGGGNSNIRALQRIGRILRIIPGKTNAAVIDFFDQAKFLKKHSIARYNIYTSESGFKILPCKEMKIE